MKRILEILSMVALLVWGSVFLYFFFSGRVNDYLNASFRIWVPIAGGGMILLGLLNLINSNRDTGACGHDHVHGDHSECDHSHGEHDHDHHDHKDCGHDHKHEDHHHHEHGEACDHEHHHHEHEHEHEHGEACDHDHEHHHHEPGEADLHHHDESTASSLAFALAVLLVPLLTAAKFSQDSFSRDYTKKWSQIEGDMQKMRQRKLGEARAVAAGQNPYTNPDGTRPEPKETGEGSKESKGGEAWGEFTLDDLKKMVPQTSAGDFLLDVPQIFYTAGDQELMKVMEGISIETTAQIIEDTVEGSPSNRLRAYRLLIECCAADARPLSIPIEFAESLPEYKEMGWYKVVGRLHFEEGATHEYVPILQIKTFQPTPEPADWMSY